MEILLGIAFFVALSIYLIILFSNKSRKGKIPKINNGPIKYSKREDVGPLESDRDVKSEREGDFELEARNQMELDECSEGDTVSLWKKHDMGYINVYRRGEGVAGGAGKIGEVDNNTFQTLAKHMDYGGRVEAKIADLMPGMCIIEYSIITREEVNLESQQYWNKRKEDLMKIYKPQKSYILELNINEKIQLRRGDKLHFDFQEKEYYIKNIRRLKLRLINNKTKRIVSVLEGSGAVRPIKAYINNYNLDITVIQKRANWLTIEVNPIKNDSITNN